MFPETDPVLLKVHTLYFWRTGAKQTFAMNVTAVEQRLDGIGELRKGQEWAPFGSETWCDFPHMKCPSKQGRLSRIGIKKRYEQDEWGKCKAWGSHKNVFQAWEPYNQPPKVPSGAAMPSLTPLTWGKKCGPWVSCLDVGEKNVNFFGVGINRVSMDF